MNSSSYTSRLAVDFALHDHLLTVEAADIALIGGLGTFALIAKANTEIIRRFAVPVLHRWLQIITQPDVDIFSRMNISFNSSSFSQLSTLRGPRHSFMDSVA